MHVRLGIPFLALLAACGVAPGEEGSIEGHIEGARPDVRIRDGALEIDGKATYLFGGEVQYFRVRDPGFDAKKTEALWSDTFQKMRAAHMNLVTTYFAWDYHAKEDGTWDFTGARNADRFLELACKAGLKVVAKPGPLITAEWPRGFGSYGAVPDFWKEKHEEALARKADGSLFDFHALPFQRASYQPTYLHPAYLEAAGEWFDRIVPIIKKYVDARCVVGVQVDNETNLYWSDRFGSVDYSDTALAHYRSFLKTRYGSITSLNDAYGSTYAGFANVVPPEKLPEKLADNVAARDWYDAGQAYIADYLAEVRGMLEERGLREPEILFSTNDSPFTIVGTVANDARHIMVHDGRVKNRFGLAGLDTYPKQIPDVPFTEGALANFPAQTSYFTKLYGTFGQLYTKDATRHFTWGTELQGGFYSLPLGVRPEIAPAATDQLMLEAVGHGLKGGSVYTLRGGLNLDGSEYDFQAGLGLDGTARPRFAVLAKWARFFDTYGGALERAEDVEDPVAVVQDVSQAAPQAATDDDHQLLYTNENPGLYDWLLDAGFNAAVVDATTAKSLRDYKAAFYFAPRIVNPSMADLLVDLHDHGGLLAQFLSPGTSGLDGRPDESVSKLAALFPAEHDGKWSWPRIPKTIGHGDMKDLVSGTDLRGYWYENFFRVKDGAKATTFLAERLPVFGATGKPIGLLFEEGGAPRALVGTYLSTVYNSTEYYTDDSASLERRRTIARMLLAKAGLTPRVYAEEVRARAFARWSAKKDTSAPRFVFVENHEKGSRALHVHAGGAALGLDPSRRYMVRDALSTLEVGEKSGAELEKGVEVPIAGYGTAVLVITPR